MPLALFAVAAIATFLYGRSHNWFPFLGKLGTTSQLPAGTPTAPPIVCDIESDMPDALKQQVLAQVASQTNQATLAAFATTLAQAGYIQSSYCLQYQAWQLGGSVGPAPAAPTAAQIAAAQAARAATANQAAFANAASSLGQVGQQVQLAPGSPDMTLTVGTIIGVTGATQSSSPPGYSVSASPTTAVAQLAASGAGADVWSVNAPGTITFSWGTDSQTTVTAVAPIVNPATASGPGTTATGPASPVSPVAVSAAQQALSQLSTQTAQTEGLG